MTVGELKEKLAPLGDDLQVTRRHKNGYSVRIEEVEVGKWGEDGWFFEITDDLPDGEIPNAICFDDF